MNSRVQKNDERSGAKSVATKSLALIFRHPVLFMDVFVRTMGVSLALKICSFKRVAEFCSTNRAIPRKDLDVAFSFSKLVERYCFKKPSCLRSALVLFWASPEAKLYIGVTKDHDDLNAHAWVVNQGITYSTELAFDRYQQLTTFEKTIL